LQPSEAIRSIEARVTTARVITASKDIAVNIIPIRIFVSMEGVYSIIRGAMQ
jgi:hypothetical protein